MSLVIKPIDLPDVPRVQRYIETLEVAHAQLMQGGDAHARLALITLDHLADVLMYRRCRAIFQEEEFLSAIIRPKVGKRKQAKIERGFKEKVNFLKSRNIIDDSTATILKICHLYRNPAHHKDIHNARTVRAIAQCLFEYVGELTASMVGGSGESGPKAGSEEHRWLEERALLTNFLSFAEMVAAVLTKLKPEVAITPTELGTALTEDLRLRAEAVLDGAKEIGFGEDDTSFLLLLHKEEFAMAFDDEDASKEYREVVYKVGGSPDGDADHEEFMRTRKQYEEVTKVAFAKFEGQLTPDGLRKIVADSGIIESDEQVPEILQRYRTLDLRLEPYETAVTHAVWRFDYEVEKEPNLRRGK